MSTSVLSSGCSPLRLAANRRNALKSSGPRTVAGKRRAALNGMERGLCSEELEKQLQARGQDPREFRDLHRERRAAGRAGDEKQTQPNPLRLSSSDSEG